jgi:hypothetical protein
VKPNGLMMLLGGGKPKGNSAEDAPDPDAEADSAEDGFISDFIDAMKDDDTEGAKAAFKAAVKACAKGYSTDKGEPDEMD